MELNLVLRTFCIIALVCALTVADSTNQGADTLEEPLSLMQLFEKRGAFKKLRSHNPILIYHQSIRQPRYLPRISSLSEEPVGGYDIPRRLIRRGNNRTHSNMAPLLVWNHQLLPNFYNKRQPPFFMSLRRDGSSSGNTKSIQATKRSSSLGWLLPPKIYEETDAPGDLYDDFPSQDTRDNYHAENDINELPFEHDDIKSEDF